MLRQTARPLAKLGGPARSGDSPALSQSSPHPPNGRPTVWPPATGAGGQTARHPGDRRAATVLAPSGERGMPVNLYYNRHWFMPFTD